MTRAHSIELLMQVIIVRLTKRNALLLILSLLYFSINKFSM